MNKEKINDFVNVCAEVVGLTGEENKKYRNFIKTDIARRCAMYKNSLAVKSRSINVEDINELTGITTDELREEVNIVPLFMRGATLGSSYSFEGHYTPAKWIEIGKQADSSKAITVSGTTNGYAYAMAKTEELAMQFEEMGVKSVLLPNTRVYDMLFQRFYDRTWLASTCEVEVQNFVSYTLHSLQDEDGCTIVGSGEAFCSDGTESSANGARLFRASSSLS